MKIAIIVEGKTEKAFFPFLRDHLEGMLQGSMPKLLISKYNGRIPRGDKLRKRVEDLLEKKPGADYVIALTDVYTGTTPRWFEDASDAKSKMRAWGRGETRFHPHAAQFEFEAWLLPYWCRIQQLAGHNKGAPRGNPEKVNHHRPPSHRIREIYRLGGKRAYIKTVETPRILKGSDLSITVRSCAELKALVNTIINLSGGEPL